MIFHVFKKRYKNEIVCVYVCVYILFYIKKHAISLRAFSKNRRGPKVCNLRLKTTNLNDSLLEESTNEINYTPRNIVFYNVCLFCRIRKRSTKETRFRLKGEKCRKRYIENFWPGSRNYSLFASPFFFSFSNEFYHKITLRSHSPRSRASFV